MNTRAAKGFSLMELVLAATISGAVVTATTHLLSNNSRAVKSDFLQQRANSIAFQCYRQLSNKLAKVGYTANLHLEDPHRDDPQSVNFDFFNIKFPIEINQNNLHMPSQSKIDVTYSKDSNILSFRHLHNRGIYKFDGEFWTSSTNSISTGERVFISRANGSMIIEVAEANDERIRPNIIAEDIAIGERALLFKLSAERLYVRKNSAKEFAMWRQRPSTKNPRKIINEQIMEHIRYFRAQFGYGQAHLTYEKTPRANELAQTVRIGIIVALENRDPYQISTPSLLGGEIKPIPGFALYPYEWNFSLAHYEI